jgi:hypothetical protein
MHRPAWFLLISLLTGAVCCAEPSPFLINMPQNSDQRCVGIAGVAEALLEGKRQEAKLSNVDALARVVYDNFTAQEPLVYPARIMLKGKGVAIDDPLALTALSDRVAELYKADYHRLSGTPAGVRQLLQAQGNTIRTRKELDEILAADSDKTVFVCCFGERTFPDRTVKDTSHAVLIQAALDGKYVVYDPNDPGAAIRCKVEDTAEGLQASWRCQYRDQQVQTTQSYLMVPQQRYFKVLRAPVPGQYSLIRQSRQSRPSLPGDPLPCNCEK